MISGRQKLFLAFVQASKTPVAICNFHESVFHLKERGLISMTMPNQNSPQTILALTDLGKSELSKATK